MQIGKTYRHKSDNPHFHYKLVGIAPDGSLVLIYNVVGGYSSMVVPHHTDHNYEEIPSEKWVSLWWTDKHKTNVSTSSAFYDSEAQADGIGRFTASDLYIKSVRVV